MFDWYNNHFIIICIDVLTPYLLLDNFFDIVTLKFMVTTLRNGGLIGWLFTTVPRNGSSSVIDAIAVINYIKECQKRFTIGDR